MDVSFVLPSLGVCMRVPRNMISSQYLFDVTALGILSLSTWSLVLDQDGDQCNHGAPRVHVHEIHFKDCLCRFKPEVRKHDMPNKCIVMHSLLQ